MCHNLQPDRVMLTQHSHDMASLSCPHLALTCIIGPSCFPCFPWLQTPFHKHSTYNLHTFRYAPMTYTLVDYAPSVTDISG